MEFHSVPFEGAAEESVTVVQKQHRNEQETYPLTKGMRGEQVIPENSLCRKTELATDSLVSVRITR